MKFKSKLYILKPFLLILYVWFSINSSFAANCSRDVKLIFEDGDERCLSEFPDFFNVHKLNDKKFDLDFFKSKKTISFASTGNQCGNGWGVSWSFTSPNENDRQALGSCEKSNANNKCKCQILLSSDAPIGALKVKMAKEDFLVQFKNKNSPIESLEKNKSLPKITITEFTEKSLLEISNFKFVTTISNENEIEITSVEDGVYGVRTNGGRNFYLIRGVLQIVEKSSEFSKLAVDAINKIYPFEVGKSTSYKFSRKNDSWLNTINVDSIVSIDTPIGKRDVFKIIHEEKGLGNNDFHEKYELYVDKKLDILWVQDVLHISGIDSGRLPFKVINIISKSDVGSLNKKLKADLQNPKKLSIDVSTTSPDAVGEVIFSIDTHSNTVSLTVDGEQQGGKTDGKYVIRRVVRVGEQNIFTIEARDVYGNADTKTVTVQRQVADSSPSIPRLNPANVRVQQSRDAVAIIVGIENYKRVAKADFANADAKDFYSYATRALGIKPENIKLLVDEGADDIEMLSAFQNWLPLKVNKGKTDVYVFYSGHGFPSQDGKGLYFLPFNVDKQYLDRTSVKQQELIVALQATKAKSVTMFIDACYSGQSRNGETLMAGLKPIALKTEEMAYPPEFTVITASAFDQLSSASADLKHGIFSFYLMKGMEGDADEAKKGRITTGDLHKYLSDKVGRQAMGMNRKQQPQLFGDADRVLVGR